jgi:hypothetical protein
MKESIAPRLQQLLPELFNPKDRKGTPGGMCAPESGCGPAAPAPRNDLATMLADLTATPPTSKEAARRPPKPARATEKAGPDEEPPR